MTKAQLKKRITVITGISITVSMVVGSGLFGLPGLIINSTSPNEAVWGWLGVSLAILPLIYIFAYLGSRYPSADGVAKYAETVLGKGGSYATTMIACGSLALGMPAFFLIVGSYIADLLHLSSPAFPAVFAVLAIGVATGLNLLGPEKFGILTKLIVPVVIVFALGFFIYYGLFPAQNGRKPLALNFTGISLHHLWIAATIAFWAFQGWENLSFGLEEFNEPSSTIPKVYWVSYVVILFIYLPFIWTVSIAANNGFNVNGISGLSNLLGNGLLRIVLLFIMIATLMINAISWTFGVSRLAFSAANKKLLPSILTRLTCKHLPINSLIICAVYYAFMIIIVYLFSIPVAKLFLLTTQGFILLYAISVLAFLKLSQGFFERCIGIAGLAACSLLLAGFSWLLFYPLILAGYGLIKSIKDKSVIPIKF